MFDLVDCIGQAGREALWTNESLFYTMNTKLPDHKMAEGKLVSGGCFHYTLPGASFFLEVSK